MAVFTDAESQCDNLEPEDSRFGYRDRGGRCEGFYNSNVSGFTLQVVSFTQGEISYVLNSNEKLRITAKPLQTVNEISLRGVNFSMSRNYRLDLSIEGGSSSDIPIKDVLLPNNLESKNLGLFGFVEKSGFRYYVPVVPMSLLSKKVKEKEKLNLRLISNLDIKEITWRYAVSQNEKCGNYSDFIKPNSRLYHRNNPIDLEIPAILLEEKEDQFICIQVSIEALNGLEFNENIRLLIPKKL